MSQSKSATLLALSLLFGLATSVALRANDPTPAAPAATEPAAAAAAATPTPAAAEPAPDAAPDLAKLLATSEERLATSLRSYLLLQNENDELKAAAARDQAAVQTAADKTVSETQVAAARTTSDALSQANAAHDEVRQLQAQVSALAAENAQLKTRLALVGPPPGTTLASPTRPGAAFLTPEPVAPAPEPAPAPRLHTVVIGDSLTKISKKYYGTPYRWEEILRVNGSVIENENNLPLGASLKIP